MTDTHVASQTSLSLSRDGKLALLSELDVAVPSTQIGNESSEKLSKQVAILLLITKHLQAQMYSHDSRWLAYFGAETEAKQRGYKQEEFEEVANLMRDVGRAERERDPISRMH